MWKEFKQETVALDDHPADNSKAFSYRGDLVFGTQFGSNPALRCTKLPSSRFIDGKTHRPARAKRRQRLLGV